MHEKELTARLRAGMKLGKDSYIHGYVEKFHPDWVKIGEKVIVGIETRIINHGPIRPYKEKHEIIIDDLVWIGFRCILLPGIHIGKCAIIGAGSVVTKDVPPYHIAAGNPAQIIRKRDKEEIKRFFVTKFLMGKSPGSVLDPDMSLLTKEHEIYLFGENDENFDIVMDIEKT